MKKDDKKNSEIIIVNTDEEYAQFIERNKPKISLKRIDQNISVVH